MATLIAYADSTLTGASTFKGAETGTSALTMIRANTTTLATNANVSSPSFTITNAHVVEGVLLWLMATAAAPAGTLLVELQLGGVTQVSVTVNCADLPHSATGTNDVLAVVPVFFKFTANHTSAGGSTYTIKLTTSNNAAATITYSRNSATTGDFTKALRTTTTATAAAADDLYIVGELTGAGTHNTRTVTMDSTATTAYGNGTVNSTSVNGGGLRISNYGTLTYGTTASTNYVLRVNGDVEVYWNGTLNVGASGAEIPRTSTAVLELQMVSATNDFGVIGHNLSTVNIAGLSRTIAKNVTQCKLTADVTGSNVLTSGPTALNVTNATTGGADPTGISLLASTAIDTVTNANHTLAFSGPSITNTTQSFQVWLARGTGTNNRFVRLEVGNNTVLASVTKGFFADVDLQAGTIGTCTAVGTGTATSSAIVAVGGGFLCTIVGKVDGSAATPTAFIAICSAAGTTSFAGANNQALLYEGVNLVTTSSIGNTTFNVDTDTGWKSGDNIIVATTNRTFGDCEDFVLNADAGATSFTSALHPLGYGGPTTSVTGTVHNGTSPIQAEIGLLTRNVKLRSTSNTLWTYFNFEPLCSLTASWAEFYYMGANTSLKYGLVVQAGAVATAKSITFCSMHDCYKGFTMQTATTSVNVTWSNNVIWNTSSNGVDIFNAFTNTDWTMDSNLVMKTGAHGFSLSDIGGTFTNNTVVAAFTNTMGIDLAENLAFTTVTLGTFTGNVVHSSANSGIRFNLGGIGFLAGSVSNFTSYRNAGLGITLSSVLVMADFTFNNITVFGNASASGNFGLSSTLIDMINFTGTNIIAGDTTFASSTGFFFNYAGALQLNINGLDMSGTTSIFAPHTGNDFSFGATDAFTVQGVLNNCKFGAPTLLNNGPGVTWSGRSFMAFEKYNQTAGDHRCQMTYGLAKTDSTFFNIATPSMRMTPSSAANKMESAPKNQGVLVAVNSGETVNVSVSVRKSVVGDGAAYNGNQPRLIQRANPALGQNSDVVLATYSASAGSWNALSAASNTATDDGAWEFVVDCDGTAGWINIDDWAVS